MKEATKWEDMGFVASSDYRKKVLTLLEIPKMPSSLSKELGINKTHISRTLNELSKKKIIECKNPDTAKGKIYVITAYGKNILKEISKL
jgi:predicted transcriptional regulator